MSTKLFDPRIKKDRRSKDINILDGVYEQLTVTNQWSVNKKNCEVRWGKTERESKKETPRAELFCYTVHVLHFSAIEKRSNEYQQILYMADEVGKLSIHIHNNVNIF